MDELKFGVPYDMKSGEFWFIDQQWDAEDGHVRVRGTVKDADGNVLRSFDESEKAFLEKLKRPA